MESDVTQSVSLFKLWGWYETNKKQVTWGTASVVVVGLVVWFVVYQHNEKEIAASEALANVTAAQMASRPAHNPPTESDLTALAAKSAADYSTVASKYPGTTAAARAQLLSATSLFNQGQYDQALAQFQRFTRDYATSPLMGEALLGIAATYDAQGKTDDALRSYKDLADHHPGEVVAPQAKFAMARLYEAQGKADQALALYEDVERTDLYGSLAPEAGMRIEELVAKHPELAPKPAAQNAPRMTIEKNK